MADPSCKGSLAFPFILSRSPFGGTLRRPLESPRRGFEASAQRLVRHGLRLFRRRLPVRAVRVGSQSRFRPRDFADSSRRVRQRCPSIDITMGVHSWTSRRPSFGALRAKPRTRSVLVVPPDFDGLLHPWFRRSVAPCNRSWGSPCFDPRWRNANTARDGSGALLYGACPSKLFPRL